MLQEKAVLKIFHYWRQGVILLGLVLAGWGLRQLFFPSSPPVEVIEDSQPEEKLVVVDVQGAVMKPGVYQLPQGSRVQDLLIACGGLASRADRDWVAKNINRAALLRDGAKFYFPFQGEVQGAVSEGGKININQATAKELEQLPGIGPSFAQKIVNYRLQHGGFRSLEEIMLVEGIGEKLFEKIKDKITL